MNAVAQNGAATYRGNWENMRFFEPLYRGGNKSCEINNQSKNALMNKDIEIQESACKKCMLEWLKQPVGGSN